MEKYGTIPPKFTKKWWEYFWMYYKWHTIIIAVIVIAIGTTVHQKMTAPRYDTTFVYAGESYFSDEAAANVEKALSPLCADVDKNGKKALSFYQISFSEDNSDPQYTMAMQMKLQLALSEDETYIYILDKGVVDAYAGESETPGVFAKLDDWLTANVPDDRKYIVGNSAVAVSLEGNKLLTDCGIDCGGKYLAIRYYPRKDQKKQIPGYEGAVKLANEILK